MECREVRALGDAYLDDELLVETNHAVLAHLQKCPTCRAELQARQTLRTTLNEAFTSDKDLAPDAKFTALLKNHLHSTATTAGAVNWLRHLPWMAATVVVAAFAIQWGLDRHSTAAMADDPAMSALVESAVGDHQDCALRHEPSEPPIPLDRASSYDAAFQGLDKAVQSSAAALAPPVKTVAAHACIWKGRRFGHVVLSYKSAIVSLLVTKPESDVVRYARAAAAECPTASTFTVACFAAPRHAVFVVSDLPAREATMLAQGLAPGVRDHLSRGPTNSIASPSGPSIVTVSIASSRPFPTTRSARSATNARAASRSLTANAM
jgi:hypothetical protein